MSVGDRVYHNSNFGTVRYVGPISGKSGSWFGIEWDDPTRGRGNGSVDGVQYFSCSSPTGASFLRTTAPSLQLGRSFVDALRDKYIEATHGSDTIESIILGSSDGAIEVEAVNMDKVRGKFAKLESLREVGLEDYLIKTAGKRGEIASTSPNIRRLDLSRNLLSSWEEVIQISGELKHLESLTLHYNYFKRLESPLPRSHSSIAELLLNRTKTTWEQAVIIGHIFPSLKHLEIGFNNLSVLESHFSLDAGSTFQNLESLNLDGNDFTDWTHLIQTVKPLPKLQALFISENQIKDIRKPDAGDQPLDSITSLVLDGNPLDTWSTVDAIAMWFPKLSVLRLFDTPLMTEPTMAAYARLLIIGKIKSLTRLNSSEVKEEERKDAELFYLNWIVKHTKSEDRAAIHPRWPELIEVYGSPEEAKEVVDLSRLQNRLMKVNICILPEDPTKKNLEEMAISVSNQTIQVLPTMPMKVFRLKLLKALKLKPKTQIKVYVRLSAGESSPVSWGEIDLNSPRQTDLQWWGIEDGGLLGVLIASS
ncbi:RNI-like protein [Serendipita vermifera]|nr:RNI-like protein [Serendipita vermifera]